MFGLLLLLLLLLLWLKALLGRLAKRWLAKALGLSKPRRLRTKLPVREASSLYIEYI